MEFKTSTHQTCYERVATWMKELFGEMAMTRSDVPLIGVLVGSAYAQVAIHPWGDDDATVTARAYVVLGTELQPELMHYLLRQNADMRFGAFGVDNEGDIFFEHTIVGSTCERSELKASVMAVAITAGQYADALVARWGGRRGLDLFTGALEVAA